MTLARWHLRFPAVLFLLTLLAFGLSLGNNFAHDDHVHISDNADVKSVSGIPHFFTSATTPGNLYRPLTKTLFTLVYTAFNGSPAAFHALALLLHFSVAMLVLSLLSKLFDPRTGRIASSIFAVHPMFTEVAANATGIFESLSAFLLLLALRVTMSGTSSTRKYVLLFVVSLAAFLSKENSLVLLLLLPLIAGYRRDYSSLKIDLLLTGSAALIYLALRLNALGSFGAGGELVPFIDNPLVALPVWKRIISAGALLILYFLMFFVPRKLGADYSYAYFDPQGSITYDLAVAGMAALVLFSLVAVARSRKIRFGLMWFFAAFAITANFFFPIGTIFGERLIYLPAVGLALVYAKLLQNFKSSKVRNALLAAVLCVYTVQSMRMSRVWRSNLTLFSHQILLSPASAKTQYNFGVLVMRGINPADARPYFEKALKIYPRYAVAAKAVADTYFLERNYTQARIWYFRSLEIDSQCLPCLLGLAMLETERGQYRLADTYIERVFKTQPGSFNAGILKAIVLFESGQREKAMKLFADLEKANPLHPDLARIRTKYILVSASAG